MKHILAITSSILHDNSQSTRLVHWFSEQLGNAQQQQVKLRDLAAEPLEHLSAQEMGAWMTAAEERSPLQTAIASVSDAIVTEVEQASALVIGMPMYNFGVPSNFKAWIDKLARAGKTFKYTENGPVGLLADKPVIIIATRGGKYQGTSKDSQTQYLKDVFAFLGLTNLQFVYAEGLAMGEAETAIAAAQSQLSALLQPV